MKRELNLYRIIASAIARHQVHIARVLASRGRWLLAAYHLRRCGWSIEATIWILLQKECRI
jgi:hypothetical protein